MKKNLLLFRGEGVFDVRMPDIFVDATRWEAKQKTFEPHCRSRFVYRLAGKPFFVELNVAERYAENSFDNRFAGLDGSPDLFRKQTNLL